MSDHVHLLLGAYVLGALDRVESQQVEEHVADCAACAAELDDLVALPGLLARVPVTDVERLPDVGHAEGLYARVRAAARPPERRWVASLAAAAVVVSALAVGAGVWRSLDPVPVPDRVTSWSATSAGIRMGVDLTPAAGGTTFRVTVQGLPVNQHCTLVAVAGDGTRHEVSRWVATYRGRAEVTGSTDVALARLTRFELLDDEAHLLVGVTF